MEKRTIAITIASVLMVMALSFLIVCTVCFWQDKTAKDTSYQDGYDAGILDKSELEISIAELKNTNANLYTQLTVAQSKLSENDNKIKELQSNKIELENQIATLSANNEVNALEITRLNALKVNYEGQIDSLSEQNLQNQASIAQLTADKTTLNSQIIILQNENTQNEQTISNLQNELMSTQNNNELLQAEIASLSSVIEQNNLQLSELQSNKTELENRITSLASTIGYNNSTINSLNAQISSMTSEISSLTNTNNTNLQTIASLNSQISILTTQISELTKSNIEQSNTISTLSANIVRLNDCIAKYDSFFSGLEIDSYAIVRFIFDDSLYNIQLVSIGECAIVINPTDTDYVIFNGWTVDDSVINLSEYPISANTTIIADVTIRYDVSFIADNNIIDEQIVAQGEQPILPDNPTKTGYTFVGWSIDGVTVIDSSNLCVNANTVYYAVFEALPFDVLCYDSDTINKSLVYTKQVAYGDVIGPIDFIPTKENYSFVEWQIPTGMYTYASVDLNTYVVTSNVSLFAKFEQVVYDIKFYDGEELLLQYGLSKGDKITNIPTPAGRDGYVFVGWTVSGYSQYVDFDSYNVTNDKIFQARYSLPYVGKYSGTSSADKEVSVDISRNNLSSIYCVSLLGSKYCALVVDDNGDVLIDTTPLNISNATATITHTLRYNADDDTWVYNYLFDYVDETKQDIEEIVILSLVSREVGIL